MKNKFAYIIFKKTNCDYLFDRNKYDIFSYQELLSSNLVDYSFIIFEESSIFYGANLIQLYRSLNLNIPFIVISKSSELEYFYYNSGASNVIFNDSNKNLINEKINKLLELALGKEDSKYNFLSQDHYKTIFFNKTKKLIETDSNQEYMMLAVDINNFKLYNHTHGYQEGNKILSKFANYFQFLENEYENLVTSRIDIDVFFITTIYKEELLDIITDKIIKFTSSLISNYVVGVSIGVYRIEDLAEETYLMFDKTMLALNASKNNFNRPYYLYDEMIAQNIKSEQFIINNFKSALKNHEFKVYIQPKYNLISQEYYGGEALVRWIHPSKGLIPPNDFIQVLEKNGLIYQLDYYIWEQVFCYIRRELDLKEKVDPISVNVSRIDLFHDVASDIIRLSNKYQVDSSLFNIEITESAYTDKRVDLSSVIKVLHQHGFKILMDDFGSGYSSLNTLKDIDIDILKVDLNFLSNSGNQGRGETILVSIIRMARWLNLPVIVEGVETIEQAELLKSIGCQMVQGYLYARPMPADDYFSIKNPTQANLSYKNNELILLDKLWSTDVETNMLFKNMIGAVCVYELFNGKLELIKANDEYVKMFKALNNQTFNNVLNFILDEYKEKFNNVFEKAKNSSQVEVLEYKRKDFNNNILDVRIKVKLITKNDEVALFYGAIDNITSLIEYNQMLKDTDLAYKIVMKQSDLSMWQYDIVNNRTLSYPLLDKKVIYEHYPEDYISSNNLDLPSTNNINNLVQRIKSGEKHAHADIKLADRTGLSRYARINYETVFENGKPIKAIGYATDLSRIMHIKEYYNRQQEREPDRVNVAMYYFYLDLSLNKVVRGYYNGNPAKDYLVSIPKLVEYFRTKVADNYVINESMEVSNLIESYYMGRAKMKYETMLNNKYYRINTIVFKNPDNNHLEAIYYIEDITVNRLINKLKQKLVVTKIDSTAIIDLDSEDIRIYLITNQGELDHIKTGNYNTVFINDIKKKYHLINENDLHRLNLTIVKEALDKKSKYIVDLNMEDGTKIIISFAYLVRIKNKVVMTFEQIKD